MDVQVDYRTDVKVLKTFKKTCSKKYCYYSQLFGQIGKIILISK